MNIFDGKAITTPDLIDKKTVLEYISEEEIFELVFKFLPKEDDYVTSPFRKDKNPGCRFFMSISGKLKFEDFGSQILIDGRRMINIDCFDAVMVYYNIKSLSVAIQFIVNSVNIDGKRKFTKLDVIPQKKEGVTITTSSRPFNIVDKNFWYDRYGITKENLYEDKVYPVKSYKISNPAKQEDYISTPRKATYCISGFENGRKKIYRPFSSGVRFTTNCTQNDIGGILNLDYNAKTLVISKSYKDFRVLKNQGVNVIWFQNEGMYPELPILLPLCNKFERVVIFYDNDNVGINSSQQIANLINSYIPNKAESLVLPIRLLSEGIKDPADLIHKRGRLELLKFVQENKLNV